MQRTGACAGRYGSSFEQTLHILIVVVIQATHRDALAVALQFASHPAVLTAVVNLHSKTAVCPKLALAAETVRCLQQCNQQLTSRFQTQGFETIQLLVQLRQIPSIGPIRVALLALSQFCVCWIAKTRHKNWQHLRFDYFVTVLTHYLPPLLRNHFADQARHRRATVPYAGSHLQGRHLLQGFSRREL